MFFHYRWMGVLLQDDIQERSILTPNSTDVLMITHTQTTFRPGDNCSDMWPPSEVRKIDVWSDMLKLNSNKIEFIKCSSKEKRDSAYLVEFYLSEISDLTPGSSPSWQYYGDNVPSVLREFKVFLKINTSDVIHSNNMKYFFIDESWIQLKALLVLVDLSVTWKHDTNIP